MYNKDEKSHWSARIVHVLLCLLTLLLVPATINSCLSTPSYGSSDGAAMHALDVLLGLVVSLVFALVGLTLLHVALKNNVANKMTVPTLLWMLAASAIASFIAEDKMFSCSLFATTPVYGVISWWFDRRMAKHKEDGQA